MGQETIVIHMTYGSHVGFPLRIVKNEGDKALAGNALQNASVFGVPADAKILLNDIEVGTDAEIQNGDEITFCKATGRKADARKNSN